MLETIRQILKAVAGTFAPRWTGNRYSPQIRARLQPYSSCFSHSAAWLLQNLGVSVSPDEITAEINGPNYAMICEGISGAYASEEYRGRRQTLWELQAWYLQDKLGRRAKVSFVTGITREETMVALQRGPVVVGIAPTHNGRTIGHVVLIVGYRPDLGYLIDDPFGDFRTRYANHLNGDNLVFPVKDFHKLMSGLAIYVSGGEG